MNCFDYRNYCNPCNTPPRYCFCNNNSFLSNYAEAVGSTQTVNTNQSVVFDITPEEIDIVGNGITVTNDIIGTLFTINRRGLYHVEWSLNLATGEAPILVGLLENNIASSTLNNTATIGNYSSGALINVNTVPYYLRLFNYGGPITIENPTTAENTAASIRILRFADGPKR